MATESSQLPMSEKRRAILASCSEDLVKYMDLNIRIWTRLVSAMVFSIEEREKIMRSGTMEEQVFELVALLMKKKNGDFDILVKCLEDYKQSHVAEILRQADAANTLRSDAQSNVSEVTSQSSLLERTHLSEVQSIRRIRSTTREFYEAKKRQSYDTAGDRKGIALIVNITQGKDQKTGKKWRRRGSGVDGDNLEKLFDDLKYDVESFEDLTLVQFMAAMESVARKAEDENAKSLFVVLMSHGRMENGKHFIASYDGWVFDVKDALKTIFGTHNLKRLAGIPKVFILQACQGGFLNFGVQVYDETEKDAEPGVDSRLPRPVASFAHYPIANAIQEDNLDFGAQVYGETEEDAEPEADPRKPRPVASFAHYLIANATREEFAENRDTTKGSWFIQEVVSVFREKAATKDIIELLMEVRQNMWINYLNEEGSIQTTEDRNTLGKKFYIFPGI